MGYKLITQIVLLVLSIAVVVMYIKPELSTIKQMQDDTFAYRDASMKIGDLNSQLNALVSKSNAFASSDVTALEAYLPSSIDTVTVMADITAMVNNSGSSIISLTMDEEPPVAKGKKTAIDITENVDVATSVNFALTMKGTYEQLKQALRSFEQNKYPLEIVALNFSEFVPESIEVKTTSDTLEGTFELVIRTYSYSYSTN